MAAGHFKYGTGLFAINKACVSILHYISIFVVLERFFWSVNFFTNTGQMDVHIGYIRS